MSDHAVLIPSSEGPVGGIVSEPGGEERAALILLPGWGRPARSGVNGFWARTARAFADDGILTLRFDYSREGETLPLGVGGAGQLWKRDLDLRLLEHAEQWLRERAPGEPLLLAGVCSGARLAIELAARRPEAIAGCFLIVPYLRALAEPGDADGTAAVDEEVVECLATSLEHAPSWVLTGERDTEDVDRLLSLLPMTAHPLEVAVLPGVALHFLDQPHLQAEADRWLTSGVLRVLSQNVS